MTDDIDRAVTRRSLLNVFGGLAVVGLFAGCDAVTSGIGAAKQIAPALGVGPSESPGPTGRLVFVRGGALVEWSGTSAQPIAAGANYRDPAWSRDGKQLVSVAAGTNHSDIVVLRGDGGSPRLLTHNRSDISVQDSIWARKPAWSPDARRIVFVSDRDKHDMSLWQITADGAKTDSLLLMKPYSGGLDWPSWSPDGTEIAFVSFASGVSQVHLLNVRLKQDRELTSVSNGAYDPSWSPDGKYIAFVARENGLSYLAVNRRADNSQHRLTINGVLRSPVWSPRGDSLAFIRQNGDRFDAQLSQISFGDAITASGPRSIDGSQGIDATAGLSWTT